MSIKYYQLAKGEEMPDEFCVVRDINGEPSEYMFYVPEAENAKLRELVKGLMGHVMHPPCEGCIAEMNCDCSDLTQCDEWLFFETDARRLGIEVDE